jgi:hypothetical protein
VKDDRLYLEHVREAIDKIQTYLPALRDAVMGLLDS